MTFGSLTLNSPVVKGVGNTALGIGICSLVVSLDSLGALPKDTYGTLTKYMLYTAGAYYVARGFSRIMVGE